MLDAAKLHVEDEAKIAIDQLAHMSTKDPPTNPLGLINPKALASCRGVFFYHTQKVGLGVGVKWGRGWLLMRTGLNPPSWSPPVFYKVLEGSIGFTAGVGGTATLIALGTDEAVESFCKGKAVLGDDFSLSLLTGDESADSDNAFDKAWKESAAWTVADGLMADASLTGGRITVDKASNESVYGSDASPTSILVTGDSAKQPAGFKGVYKALNHIIAAAERDPRKWSGFKAHWRPGKHINGDASTQEAIATGSAAPGTDDNPTPKASADGGKLPQPEGGKAKTEGAAMSEEEKQGLLFSKSHAHQA